MKVTAKMFHPQIRFQAVCLSAISRSIGLKPFFAIQKLLANFFKGRPSQNAEKREMFAQRLDGTNMRLCVFSKKGEKPKDAVGLVWLHSGGYSAGTPDQEWPNIRTFVLTADCVAVVPEYRLSGEAPYPAALEDAYEALRWLYGHAEELGVSRERLFVGGVSAGGGLAACTALLARDRGGPPIAFQLLFYPMLDDRMDTPSMKGNDAPVWNEAANLASWKAYLGDLFETGGVPPTAAPSRAEDLSALPPAYGFVGGVDPFCDETREYFQRLKAAGVDAEVDIYEGCFHAFEQVAFYSAVAKEAKKKAAEKFCEAAGRFRQDAL
ncbi:MAG: alpha/beta hydrolase [Eubacteriaceae bacterium]|nr:alpha/beta hydrolase [Eubacteriaceae bacterium]